MAEILRTRVGEMLEMINCDAIAHGAAPMGAPKMAFENAMKLR